MAIVRIGIVLMIFSIVGDVNGEIGSGSENGKDEFLCHVVRHDQCFPSIEDALKGVTINTIISIKTDIVLSSNIILEDFKNITIIGESRPTIDCNGLGSVKFASCNGVNVEGIIWKSCGFKTMSSIHPGIEFHNSSNIVFQHCSIHNSIGQAIVLSNVSGNVTINNCYFTHNNQFQGHGSVLHYLSRNIHPLQLLLVIKNCTFSFNSAVCTESMIYINNTVRTHSESIHFQNCSFYANEGVPIYVLYQNLHLYGNIVFHYNGGGIFGTSSVITFHEESYVKFTNNYAKNSGGALYIDNSEMYFRQNSFVHFNSNTAEVNGGALFAMANSSIVVFGNSCLEFYNNSAGMRGGAVCCTDRVSLLFSENSTVQFNANSAEYGGAVCVHGHGDVSFDGDSSATFTDNNAVLNGGALYIEAISEISFDSNSSLTFTDNHAVGFGGVIYGSDNSSISFNGNSFVTFTDNTGAIGGAVYTGHFSDITFDGNTSVTFTGNTAFFGGAVYSEYSSDVIFNGNAKVNLNRNDADFCGGAVHISSHCHVSFTENSVVTFNNNHALSGGALYAEMSSSILFDGISKVTFNKNLVSQFGGAVYNEDHCDVRFCGWSTVRFYENYALLSGGAVYIDDYCNARFDGNVNVIFSSNHVEFNGGALHSESYSDILVGGNVLVTFNNNYATTLGGGGLCSQNNSNVLFDDDSMVKFIGNSAAVYGGAIYLEDNSNISFTGRSAMTFNVNRAMYGGAIYSEALSNIIFLKNSTVTFKGNYASSNGGAVHAIHSEILLIGNSLVIFNKNRADNSGGGLFTEMHCSLLLGSKSIVIFINNSAVFYGGALYSINYTTVLVDGQSVVQFIDNSATCEGSVCSEAFSNSLISGDSKVTFEGSNVRQDGGAIYSVKNSAFSFAENATVIFSRNTAIGKGGALYISDHSVVSVHQYSILKFYNNTASNGGAIYNVANSSISFEGNVSATFMSNTAEYGGAVYILHSSMILQGKSLTMFYYNKAMQNGGAIYLTSSYNMTLYSDYAIAFQQNSAGQLGGAIYGEISKINRSKIFSDTKHLVFNNNSAFIGHDAYINIRGLCDEICFNNSVIGLSVTHNNPPLKLVLYDPAICTDNQTTCKQYLLKNVMLGQDLKVNACVVGLFEQPAGRTDFLVNSSNENYTTDGVKFVSVACKTFEGIRIIGKQISCSANFSMRITSHATEKKFFIELITELSPCHPGFYHDNDTQKCACYSDGNIVSCSGSTSFIKRGHWFGMVNEKSTVSVCPNNYCNFTCCESRDGFYHLSPVRINQCNSQRSGTACGSCTKDYTLSFDSAECVSVNQCTTGQTVLVVTLSMIYWIVIVILVFIVTCHCAGVGYLYAITYYYSMLDILLNHNLFLSRGLFTIVSIMSSIAKVRPQFLGKLCLVENMSGIDQQFIHFVHPLAVTIIVVLICLSARVSYKFSAFISRSIIRVICYLLLLSYTSVATTSLLLLRSLTFHNVDKVFVYSISPDIEYFHGRHFPYSILAVLCVIVIVIGLPLFLLIEPFINHKINFTKIKPLLDQFQGCYKNKYRCFAAYYMICRLVIILIIVTNPYKSSLTHFLLIFSSTILAFIPVMVRPYATNTLNIFDGLILQLVILVTMIPLVDNFNTDLSFVLAIFTLMLPLLLFVAMKVLINKKTIKKIATYCRPKGNNNHTEIPMSNITADDSMRTSTSTTIVDINDDYDNATHYRESFMEVMNEIKD